MWTAPRGSSPNDAALLEFLPLRRGGASSDTEKFCGEGDAAVVDRIESGLSPHLALLRAIPSRGSPVHPVRRAERPCAPRLQLGTQSGSQGGPIGSHLVFHEGAAPASVRPRGINVRVSPSCARRDEQQRF